MNLGDGLLFEFENGKPKLILLSHGVEKNPAKMLFRPRAANILSSRQLSSCLEDVQEVECPNQQQAGRCKEARSKTGGAMASSMSNTSNTKERSTLLTSSKTHGHHDGAGIKAVTKVNSHRHKQGSMLGSLRASGKTAKLQNSGVRAGGKAGLKDKLADGDAGQKDSVVVLTNEQLQQILNNVQTSGIGQQPPEEHKVQGSQSGTSINEGGGGEMKEEDRGGGEVLKREEGGGGVIKTTGTSEDKHNRLSGCLSSWLEEQQLDSRLATGIKKAQWRRELDEQVALKQQQQQRLAPDRPQSEDDRESVLSLQSSIKHRDQPAAIRSSLKLGDITPMEEVMSVERREVQRRRWLEELDRQREETAERRRREKLLQSQTEDHDLWTTHFDSLQRRPPVHTTAPSAPPPAPSSGSEQGEWEPSSSLSLVWEATSSCGAESVGGASVDMTNRFPSRASYLRTMTALLDPTQIEEREKRRLKQLEQQRAIEAQVEERRQQREREQVRRREEEEKDARRVAVEREMLQRQYELESQKEQPSQQAEQPRNVHNVMVEPNVTGQSMHLEKNVSNSVPPYKDTAVQTEEAPSVPLTEARVQTPDVAAQYQPPVAPPNSRNPTVRTGKENICLSAGGDPYEAFARTERNKRDKRRPEWNTQKPSRRFVPASERYPAALQRNRQESRLKRQAELLALQERTCLARTEPPPPPPPPPQHQDPRLCSNFKKVGAGPNKAETVSREQNISTIVNNERHRMQSRPGPNPLPPLVQEFVPYIRTDEITLNPLESAVNPPPHTCTDAAPLSSASPPASSHRDTLLPPEQLCKTHTQRQQEILRGLAQLRQGLLQKQRELETDLNPLLKRHDNNL